mgnify:FL=1
MQSLCRLLIARECVPVLPLGAAVEKCVQSVYRISQQPDSEILYSLADISGMIEFSKLLPSLDYPLSALQIIK